MAQDQQEQIRSAGRARTRRVATGSWTQDQDPPGAGLKSLSTVMSRGHDAVTSSGF